MPEEQQRWYAIKLFERDEKVLAQLDLSDEIKNHIEHDIAEVETELDEFPEKIFSLILGTPKHVPKTKLQPKTPLIKGKAIVFPNEFV